MMVLPDPRDYITSIENPQLVKAKELQGGTPVRDKGKLIRYTGGFCIVFPYEVSGHKYAVRCWKAAVANAKERTRLIAETLGNLSLPYFVEFKYIDNGIIAGVATSLVLFVAFYITWIYFSTNPSDSNLANLLIDIFSPIVAILFVNTSLTVLASSFITF